MIEEIKKQLEKRKFEPISNLDSLLKNKEKLKIEQDFFKYAQSDSEQIINEKDILKQNEEEERDIKSLSPKNINMSNLDLRNRQKLIIESSFQKSYQPQEGEIKEYKDGSYKFENGHWKKIKEATTLISSIPTEGTMDENSSILFNIYEKVNFNYDGQKYKVEVLEDNGDLVKIKMLETIEIEDKDHGIHKIKPGYTFYIGRKTLEKI